jgi:hypothetical protein
LVDRHFVDRNFVDRQFVDKHFFYFCHLMLSANTISAMVE